VFTVTATRVVSSTQRRRCTPYGIFAVIPERKMVEPSGGSSRARRYTDDRRANSAKRQMATELGRRITRLGVFIVVVDVTRAGQDVFAVSNARRFLGIRAPVGNVPR